ncbi:hypothetical protein CAEBREN_29225 [Caenorhabditis brenneri]|uniref:Uncharacterized protein n=1 Tax=Caenorhabditis brenneri TaxID=135651 RepID=G0P7M4_CAEBE|nr:hypothetical protein CAEBREN_29225 [Caenorhabditis brenneri]
MCIAMSMIITSLYRPFQYSSPCRSITLWKCHNLSDSCSFNLSPSHGFWWISDYCRRGAHVLQAPDLCVMVSLCVRGDYDCVFQGSRTD